MFVSRKLKIFILVFFILFFALILYFLLSKNIYYSATQITMNENDIVELKSNLRKTDSIDLNVSLADNKAYYNAKENTYYYYVDYTELGDYKNLETLISGNKKYNFILFGNNYKFENIYYIDVENPINLLVYNDEYYYEALIRFTSVPILNINVENEITINEENSYIELYGGQYDEAGQLVYINNPASIKVRGSSSLVYPKKNYKITLFDGG